MADYKEQMLADVKTALRNKKYWHERKHHAEFDFDLFLQDFEQILSSLPSEKEIAKGVIDEYIETVALPDTVLNELGYLKYWLDKEGER